MSEIPEDIRKIANNLSFEFAVANLESPAEEAIAQAILAERERCAKIADRKIVEAVAFSICKRKGQDPAEMHCGSYAFEAWEEGFREYEDYFSMAKEDIASLETAAAIRGTSPS